MSWSVRNDELTTIGELSVDSLGRVAVEVIGTGGLLSEADSIELARRVIRNSIQGKWKIVDKAEFDEAMRLMDGMSDEPG